MVGRRTWALLICGAVIATGLGMLAPRSSGAVEDPSGPSKEWRAALRQLRRDLAQAQTEEERRAIRRLLVEEMEAMAAVTGRMRGSAADSPVAHRTPGPGEQAPSLAPSSLSIEGDLALGDGSTVFRGDDPYLSEPPPQDLWNNLGLGRRALSNNTVGRGNTAVGTDALANNDTEIGYLGYVYTAERNTAVGVEAMYNNVSSSNNTAVGWWALYQIGNFYGDSSINTAVGSEAARQLGRGAGNTVLGAFALRNMTSGDLNTVVGAEAMYNVQGSFSTTAVGHTAMQMATGGDFNTAIGARALLNTTGGFNTAVGAAAMSGNTSGDGNTALGLDALFNAYSGSNNTALGHGSLYNNSSGDRNIAVGYLAGSNLGYDPAGSPLGGSDNIHIGNLGVDGDNGAIRIGTTGTHVNAYVAGIYNNPVTGYQVYADSSGRLGSAGGVSSSRRLKENIEDLGLISQRLHELRPVSFRRKGAPTARTQFGLIAEEVAEVLPELVVFDEEGRPRGVRYQLLSSLLLAEVQKQQLEMARLKARLARIDR